MNHIGSGYAEGTQGVLNLPAAAKQPRFTVLVREDKQLVPDPEAGHVLLALDRNYLQQINSVMIAVVELIEGYSHRGAPEVKWYRGIYDRQW